MPSCAPFESVKQSLTSYSPKQLNELKARCSALLSISKQPETNEDWLLEGVFAEIKSRGIPIPPMSKLRLDNSFKSYSQKSEVIRTLLESQGDLTKLQKRQLAIICTKCLAAYLDNFTEVSLHSVFTFVDRIPEALERSFPGYLSSHLLLFILKGGNNEAG